MTYDTAGGPAPTTVPVCPRHPDRPSYVRCQRCERPACPECQRTAAVGVHCIDCVRETARTAPVARTAFGAPLRSGPPVVTMTLIGLCVVSFVLQLATRTAGGGAWTRALIFAPVLGDLEPWRFLTAGFLHSTGMLLHLLFNMYALWVLGQNLELALGRWRFLALYLLSIVGGSVAVLLLADPSSRDWLQSVLGASGGVFGLFGALLIVLRRLGRNAQGILVVIGINALLGFVIPNVSWEAHLGGLAVGALLGLAYAYAPRDRRREVSVGATVGVALLLVAFAMLRYATV